MSLLDKIASAGKSILTIGLAGMLSFGPIGCDVSSAQQRLTKTESASKKRVREYKHSTAIWSPDNFSEETALDLQKELESAIISEVFGLTGIPYFGSIVASAERVGGASPEYDFYIIEKNGELKKNTTINAGDKITFALKYYEGGDSTPNYKGPHTKGLEALVFKGQTTNPRNQTDKIIFLEPGEELKSPEDSALFVSTKPYTFVETKNILPQQTYTIGGKGDKGARVVVKKVGDSNRNREIAFISIKDGNSNICLMNLNSGDTKQIEIDRSINNIDFSPDGQRILIEYSNTSHFKKWPSIVTLDTSKIEEIDLENFEGDRIERSLRNLKWSPDGEKILFESHHSYEGDQFGILNLKEKKRKILGNCGHFNEKKMSPVCLDQFKWSPDGKNIAFATYSNEDEGSDSEIYIVNLNDGSSRKLTDNLNYDGDPMFSPNGKKIAFGSLGLRSSRDLEDGIYTINTDGTNLEKLRNLDSFKEISWSPDGSHILFVSNKDLYTINMEGGLQRLTYDSAKERDISWSPDGKKILFEKEDEIYVIDSNGKNLQQLTINSDIDFSPIWRPIPQ